MQSVEKTYYAHLDNDYIAIAKFKLMYEFVNFYL